MKITIEWVFANFSPEKFGLYIYIVYLYQFEFLPLNMYVYLYLYVRSSNDSTINYKVISYNHFRKIRTLTNSAGKMVDRQLLRPLFWIFYTLFSRYNLLQQKNYGKLYWKCVRKTSKNAAIPENPFFSSTL